MDFLLFYLVIVPSAIFHEYMHGFMAERLGDPTARYAGRLTLNPLAHIDPIGTVLLPILLIPTGFLFAYAKPVPYNPYNLRNQRTGPVWVALAGPFANVLLALVFGLLVRYGIGGGALEAFALIAYANIMLCVFNLVPIPPLDGSKVLLAIIPDSLWKVRQVLEQWGYVLLIAFIFFFSHSITPIVGLMYQLIVGVKGPF